ncbi:MAG: DUF3782 domain-containing protein [Bacteroidia bacterium]|nr:DUF3782 domain-containing protein [Bacteroidia bacterium]
MALPMSMEEAKRLVEEFLKEPEIRAYIEQSLSSAFAPRQQTEGRIERLYEEIVRLREGGERRWQELKEESDARWAEMQRKWQELKEESDARWAEMQRRWQELKEESDARWAEMQRRWQELKEESDARWAEMQRKWQEVLEQSDARWEEAQRKWQELKVESDNRWAAVQLEFKSVREELRRLNRRLDSMIGAIGARWGYAAEDSFRSGIRALLEEEMNVQVERFQAWDEEGMVFGRPDQVELDLVIYDGRVIIAEISASVSKADVFTFLRKIAFYEKKKGREVQRKMIIAPMIHPKAREAAERFGIEVYSYPTPEELEKGPQGLSLEE